ncbi:hypothetical protein U9M48_021317 [Paspalum notatum var. saurae]|uniref:BHLH domain-containing protein n=1 Tax=Paspalum notatum var. saurae TaxID=547442 RepID=A0AAQ3TIH6_PASNO
MMSSLMPCAAEEQEASNSNKMSPLSSPSMLLLPHHLLHISSGLQPPAEVNSTATNSLPSDQLHDGRESSMPESWSQLLLGDLVRGHERYNAATALLSKGLEEAGPVPAAYNAYGQHGGEEIQTSGTNRSQMSQTFLASSPRSCITTSLGSNMLDFSNNTVPAPDQLKNHHSDNSSEGNSTASGSAPKKARVQTSSSAQSSLKVRKERLGDRITALHQIVSPFGKTDTASVLQETIGYIRFLLSQIEALSFPYLGHGNGNSMQQQHSQMQLAVNHSTSNKNGSMVQAAQGPTEQMQELQDEEDGGDCEEAGNKKDYLRSRGLCLLPVSYCTSHLADDDNAAASDFWAVAAAPAPAPAPPRPPQLGAGLGGIIWG